MSHREQHRGKEIAITIDGRVCKGFYGQTILQIARENDIYIPTMCYLTKVTPIASCRMCVVKVQGVDGNVLSCQEKAVNGAVITTNNEELYKHRQNIMKLYNVNHPLECGVCDKSGECDLQNKTLQFGVDSQEFAARDLDRKKKKWGILGYDPSLCIMCEKCVHTCNEVIGSAALYIKPGGYKSIIDIKMSRCEQCGDCISVCPVGALISNEYKYTSNAWESSKVPATCAHCSSGCSLYYETKHAGIGSFDKKITRVTNDFEFSAICGAGRFGFEFENKSTGRDPQKLKAAAQALKQSDVISFNSYITNEEAMILQKLKEQTGIRLWNDDAKFYQNFMNEYSSITGSKLYSATNETVKQSDLIIMMGTRISRDNPVVKYAVNIAVKSKKADFIYMHPIDDLNLQNKYNQFIKYEAGSEEGVMAMLASYLIQNVPDQYKSFFEDLDIGNLSGECSIGEEEIESIVRKLPRKKNKTLIVGEDLYAHKKAKNIARLVGLIDKYTDFNVMVIPSQTNTLGVSLICDLDEKGGDRVFGYNQIGQFVVSSEGCGDIEVAALNQQEGTFTNIDKNVVNTNVALAFDGYTLNDIANEVLDNKKEYTVEYTKELPTSKGFKAVEFDSLGNGYDKYGNDRRGYALEDTTCEILNPLLDQIDSIDTYNGTVIYRCEPLHQFNTNTAKSLKLQTDKSLRGSASFATAAKIKDGDQVSIIYNNKSVVRKFKVDKSIKGTIALCPTFDHELEDGAVTFGYRFKKVQIQKVES
ncbi:MAG: (2Fe-2S)-binding protein [Campylobacterales bacterium]|nr:(2Fe-2S)-binding protein [Campylobacterales bacterium]